MGQQFSNNGCLSSKVLLCLDRREDDGDDPGYFNDASEKPISRKTTRASGATGASGSRVTLNEFLNSSGSPPKEERTFENYSSFGPKEIDKQLAGLERRQDLADGKRAGSRQGSGDESPRFGSNLRVKKEQEGVSSSSYSHPGNKSTWQQPGDNGATPTELDHLMISSESVQNQVAHVSSDEQPGKRIQINGMQAATTVGARPQQDGDFVDTERRLQPNGLTTNYLGHVEVVRDRDLAETEEPNSSYIPNHSVFSGPNTAPNLQQTNSTSNQLNDEAADERLYDDKSPPLRISERRTESPNSMVLQQTKKIGGVSRPPQRNRNISPDRFKPDDQPEDEVISINSVKELSIVSVSEPVQEKAELEPVNVKAVEARGPEIMEALQVEEVDLEAQDSMLVKGGESVGRYQAKLEEDLDKIEVQNQAVSVKIENESPKAPSRRSKRGNESKDFSSENDFDLDMISERKPEESQVITTVDDNLQIQQSLHQGRTSAQEQNEITDIAVQLKSEVRDGQDMLFVASSPPKVSQQMRGSQDTPVLKQEYSLTQGELSQTYLRVDADVQSVEHSQMRRQTEAIFHDESKMYVDGVVENVYQTAAWLQQSEAGKRIAIESIVVDQPILQPVSGQIELESDDYPQSLVYEHEEDFLIGKVQDINSIDDWQDKQVTDAQEEGKDFSELFESSTRNIVDFAGRDEELTFEQIHVPWQHSKMSISPDSINNEGEDSTGSDSDYLTYDSISCIAIEMQYRSYLQSEQSRKFSKASFLADSVIDFAKSVETRGGKDCYRVRRLDSSEREEGEELLRPLGTQRFTMARSFLSKDEEGQKVEVGAYAWLVKQYIASHGLEITRRSLRQGLLNEINAHEKQKCGLEEASVHSLNNEQRESIDLRVAAWELLLKAGGLGADEQLDEEVDPTLFHDPGSKLAQLIVQLYCMESFFHEALQSASMNKDESKVLNLGPYALCLRSLLYGASEEREDVPKGGFTAYRAFLIDEKQLDDFRNQHKSQAKLSLLGFTSASLDQAHALSQLQILSYLIEQKRIKTTNDASIRMMVHLNIDRPEDNFLVNSARFSPFFQSEKEVILQDGMEFKIEKAQFAKKNQAKKLKDVQVMYLKQA